MNDFERTIGKIKDSDLNLIIAAVLNSKEYQMLGGKTQTLNIGVETIMSEITTRLLHSNQVGITGETISDSNGLDVKEKRVSYLTGIGHDLGHTPFGHDGESFFTKKTGKRFEHSEYGSMIFEKLYNRIIAPENGIINCDLDSARRLGEYIKAGIKYHQKCYYITRYAEQIKEIQAKKENGQTITKEEEQILMAFDTPCIQAAMLADTLSIMQSDISDLSKTGIIKRDEVMSIVSALPLQEAHINKIMEQLSIDNPEGLSREEKSNYIFDQVKLMDPSVIQTIVAAKIGSRTQKGERFESIPDEYKCLLDGNAELYEHITGEPFPRGEELEDAQKAQREKMLDIDPLLCLTYEIQNELVYNQIIYTNRIKLLGNDLDRNYAIFSRVYDYTKDLLGKSPLSKEEEELLASLNIPELEDCPEFIEIKPEDTPEEIKMAQITNRTVYFLQQKGNSDIKELYVALVQAKENKVLDSIDQMHEGGKTDTEIARSLGVDSERFEEFSAIDQSKKIAVMLMTGKKTKEEVISEIGEDGYESLKNVGFKPIDSRKTINPIEIAEKYLSEHPEAQPSSKKIMTLLRMEKRDLKEILEGKSTIERYVEYEMPLEEMDAAVRIIDEQHKGKSETVIEDKTKETKGELQEAARSADAEVTPEERREGTDAVKDLQSEREIQEKVTESQKQGDVTI